MRVQSIFTYTLPAAGPYAKTPPAAPISCGCNDLILILKDRSLVQTVLQGILRVEIKNVTLNADPVPTIDGSGLLVWKYDYTVEYNTEDLTDINYRVRKCDVEFNCCYGCGLAYADRQLLGYVQTVTGDGVNNADPQNPVVASDALVNNENRSFTHTAADGTQVIFCQGIQVVDGGNDGVGGVGAGYMIKDYSFPAACTLRLKSAPEHGITTVEAGGTLTLPATLAPGDGSVVTGPVVGQNTLTVTNTTLRTMTVLLGQAASFVFNLRGPASELIYSIETSIDGGAFNAQSTDRAGIVGMPGGSLVTNSKTLSIPSHAIWALAPGASVVIANRLRFEATAGIVDMSTQSLRMWATGITQ